MQDALYARSVSPMGRSRAVVTKAGEKAKEAVADAHLLARGAGAAMSEATLEAHAKVKAAAEARRLQLAAQSADLKLRWDQEVQRLEAAARSTACVGPRQRERPTYAAPPFSLPHLPPIAAPEFAAHLKTCAVARRREKAKGSASALTDEPKEPAQLSKHELAIAAARQRATSLVLNECVDCYIVKHAASQPTTLRIVALGGHIDPETVGAVLDAVDALMDKGQSFHTSWDLRNLPAPPPLSQAVRTVDWGFRNKSRLDGLNMRLTILMPQQLTGLQNLVHWMLGMLGPQCPVYLGHDPVKAACWELEREYP